MDVADLPVTRYAKLAWGKPFSRVDGTSGPLGVRYAVQSLLFTAERNDARANAADENT